MDRTVAPDALPARPGPPPDRATTELDIASDDPSAVANDLIRIATPETAAGNQQFAHLQAMRDGRIRELNRQQDSLDRMEWSARWQQRLVLTFIGFVLLFLCAAAVWAFWILALTIKSPHEDMAHDIVKLLIESGIAALIGFFAIKTFEK